MAHSKQTGFTIAETLIAVSVFSVLALLTMMVILQLGRSYQLGASKAQILNASRQVHTTFEQAVQFSSDVSTAPGHTPPPDTSWSVWCAGNTRFVWKNSSGATVYTYPSGSLYTDTTDSSACTSRPFNTSASDAKQMLPSNSFVNKFIITSSGGSYTLTTRFGLGTADMYIGGDVNNACQSSLIGTSFCAVVQYQSTAVKKVAN